jgi:uncharacterized protein YukE
MTDIAYPVESMRDAAQRIRANAQQALGVHEQHWRLVQGCIARLPGFMQSSLHSAVLPYDRHVRTSLQTQLTFADTLDQAATTMSEQDRQIAADAG